jgi:hypothetical protein
MNGRPGLRFGRWIIPIAGVLAVGVFALAVRSTEGGLGGFALVLVALPFFIVCSFLLVIVAILVSADALRGDRKVGRIIWSGDEVCPPADAGPVRR